MNRRTFIAASGTGVIAATSYSGILSDNRKALAVSYEKAKADIIKSKNLHDKIIIFTLEEFKISTVGINKKDGDISIKIFPVIDSKVLEKPINTYNITPPGTGQLNLGRISNKIDENITSKIDDRIGVQIRVDHPSVSSAIRRIRIGKDTSSGIKLDISDVTKINLTSDLSTPDGGIGSLDVTDPANTKIDLNLPNSIKN